jgi:FlaA1/EpsC-like NDP-sugar epimerase
VLITGGAGSIGSELARQVAALHPARLVLLEQAESPLYFIHLELARHFPQVEVVPVIADVVNQARIDEVFAAYRPHCVFHAAAYKHVPMMEHNVIEAVRNNVFGTWCVAHHAAKYGAERFVLISTDKAVRPSSIMGATKRIAERVVLGTPALRDAATDFRAVRFGNVLGSDGSVIPLFKRQLQEGGPLTVTHPDVTRYFMTIPEASQLVLLAATLPEAAGRISMLEMGQPVRIVNLAENLIRLSGLEPGRDVRIEFTGLRPGEKLHEELMSDVEASVPTMVEKLRIVQTDEPDGRSLAARLDELAASVELAGDDDVIAAICDLVPECVAPLQDRGVDALTRRVGVGGSPDRRPGNRLSSSLVPAAPRIPVQRRVHTGGPGGGGDAAAHPDESARF